MSYNYSVVILSFNHPDLTIKTVQSVLGLNFPPQQLFLIHNGSERKNVEHLQKTFKDIHHVVIQHNCGYSGGANIGLQMAFKNDSSVLFLTNDTEALELPKQFPQKLDLFSILILKRQTQDVDSVIGLIDLSQGRLQHLKALDPNWTTTQRFQYYIPGTAFGIQRSAFLKLEGFDETLHTYWEDVDLSLKAHQAGLKLGFCDLFKVRHKIGKTCHKNRFYTLYLFQRNRRRIVRKYGISKWQFSFYYHYDMLKILFKILNKPKPKTHLNLWWKALNDKTL